ncbi:tyrosine-type recombinase/integrase [Marinomonas rhizomae]|uniref:tyrosine-type recombinase/integrase n=1 Tax=Marinomonas rhizomae TaxID=491948 RepID=UPI0015826107|nr:tyrosine-type recombinase/integrase [Marinomonas rhizomae]
MNERDHLIFSLLHGSGLRISECLRIRIQDLNLDQGSLVVRCNKRISSIKLDVFISLYSISQHPLTGELCRHHLHDSVPRKALKAAVYEVGINEKK